MWLITCLTTEICGPSGNKVGCWTCFTIHGSQSSSKRESDHEACVRVTYTELPHDMIQHDDRAILENQEYERAEIHL